MKLNTDYVVDLFTFKASMPRIKQSNVNFL